MAGLDAVARLLSPRSIAILGASRDRNKMSGVIVPTLVDGGYAGKIFPVNRSSAEIEGYRCYDSLAAIPEPVDHCIIVLGREHVADALRQCRARDVGGASIWSSGFAELDEDGKRAQAELREVAGGMPFIGPNCMGFANLGDKLIAASAALMFERNADCGDLALLSQSGGIAFASFCYFADAAKLRFSHVVNTGNTAGVSFADLVEFMFDDARTNHILAVIESGPICAEVIERVRRLGLRKPIVLLKLGRGPTGTAMALSHTGSQAGDYAQIRDAAEGVGITCVDDIDEALDAVTLLRNGITGAHADDLAAVSISGGNLTLFADHADVQGLRFAALQPETEAKLRARLPPFITIHNPIDITGAGFRDLDMHGTVLRILAEDPGVRTIIPIITTSPDYSPACRMLAQVKADCGCAMIALWNGGSFEEGSAEILAAAGIPIVKSPGGLARVLHKLRRAARPG